MSPVHGSQGQQFARPPAQTQNQWGQPTQVPQAPQAPQVPAPYGQPQAYAPQPAPYGGQSTYGNPLSNTQAPTQAPLGHTPDDYGYAERNASLSQAYGNPAQGQGGSAQGYAPQFEPYVPAPQPRAQQPYNGGYQQQLPHAQPAPVYAQQNVPYGVAPTYAATNAPQQPAWNQPQDNRGFDLGTYMPNTQPSHGGHDPAQPQTDWGIGGYQNGHDGYANADQTGGELGFAQAQGGELDQGYEDDESQEYEVEEAPRGRRPMMIGAVLAAAIAIGGGLTYTYKSVLGGNAGGDPPIVKSAAAPSKVKPEDGGGKQFSHADSKIMGRLGDGSSGAGASAAAASEVDANGTRKVSTLVVGRDGSIQPPSAEPTGDAAAASIAVPGMTVVDGLGPSRAPAAAATMASVNSPPSKVEQPAKVAAAEQPGGRFVVSPSTSPAPQKPVTIAKSTATSAPPAVTASVEPDITSAAPSPPAKPIKKAKAAAVVPAPTNSVATTGNGANGFVAVLASVPRSDSSRMDALKRFADMQQKYASVLAGKTPDVAEANLGNKGAYHRLVVGPPGSREQASTVCTQLKTQGYGDCWVTSY